MTGIGRKNADTLALALAAGDSIADASTKAGVSERTAYRRLDDPAFRRRIQEMRGEMLSRALGRLADGMTEAADVLRGLLRDESPSIRLGAARSMLDLSIKLREAAELEDRIAALETVVLRNES